MRGVCHLRAPRPDPGRTRGRWPCGRRGRSPGRAGPGGDACHPAGLHARSVGRRRAGARRGGRDEAHRPHRGARPSRRTGGRALRGRRRRRRPGDLFDYARTDGICGAGRDTFCDRGANGGLVAGGSRGGHLPRSGGGLSEAHTAGFDRRLARWRGRRGAVRCHRLRDPGGQH